MEVSGVMMRAPVMYPSYLYPPTYPYAYYYNPWAGYYVWEW